MFDSPMGCVRKYKKNIGGEGAFFQFRSRFGL